MINHSLSEIILRTPWPLNHSFSDWQLALVKIFNRKIFLTNYDIMISTVGALGAIGSYFNAKMNILRLQDLPYDFGMSKVVVNRIEKLISTHYYQQIWAVSHGLVKYAKKLGAQNNFYLPNGVELTNFMAKFSTQLTKRCIYVGAFDDWLDLNLIVKVANLLPDWEFDLYGKWHKPIDLATNIRYCGSVSYKQLPELFTNYAVGLIPFKNNHHMSVVERPLKFSQYLATGLGVASTNYGGLSIGMGDWASYGNSPLEFAQAIEQAYQQHLDLDKAIVEAYLSDYEWQTILTQMLSLLNNHEIQNFTV
jgi:hypothetical protein